MKDIKSEITVKQEKKDQLKRRKKLVKAPKQQEPTPTEDLFSNYEAYEDEFFQEQFDTLQKDENNLPKQSMKYEEEKKEEEVTEKHDEINDQLMLDYEGYENEFLKENLKGIGKDAGKVFDTIMDLSGKLGKMGIEEKKGQKQRKAKKDKKDKKAKKSKKEEKEEK